MPSSTSTKEPRHPEVVGRAVEKYFLNGDGVHELFNGTVQKFRWDEDHKKHLYHIHYEDDDAESLFWEEVEEILVPEESDDDQEEAITTITTITPTKSGRKRAPVVTPQTSRGDSDRSDAMDKDKDDDFSVDVAMDEDNEEAAQVETPKKKKTRKSQMKSAPKTKPSTLLSTRSISKWGLPRGALAQCPQTNFTIRALESIPPNPSNPSALLPGRLLLVETDTAGIVDKGLIGRSFESSAELHQQIQQGTNSKSKIRFATYELQAISDPAFSSWEFAMARLDSISVKRHGDDDDRKRATMVCVTWDEKSVPSVTVSYWTEGSSQPEWLDCGDVKWALLEAQHPGVLPVLLGAPVSLLESSFEMSTDNSKAYQDGMDLETPSLCEDEDGDLSAECKHGSVGCASRDLLPQYVNSIVAKVKLAASLLQKSIRRGSMLSSPAPLLEAARDLIHPTHTVPGSTFAFLKTLWGCMLVDMRPFLDSPDCLGLPGVLALSLVAKADPRWVLPNVIRRAAVASALRSSHCPETKQWVGFVSRDDYWHYLESVPLEASANFEEQNSILIRNLLRVTQSVAGDSVAWGRWNSFTGEPSAAAALAYANDEFDGSILPKTPRSVPNETLLLDDWGKGLVTEDVSSPIMLHLDQECRLAAIEPNVAPQLLVLLQASLAELPRSWKKHSLPSLARQVRKLSAEANPRIRETLQLARLATWGKDASLQSTTTKTGSPSTARPSDYKSYREVITTTGTLSVGETEVVDCLEAIQKWQIDRTRGISTVAANVTVGQSSPAIALTRCQLKAGPPLSASDGRIAFLLSFAEAIEVEVRGEVVSAMFCGNTDEPLLVQRIGKARNEGKEMATAGGATSGATAVPSLGYVQRARSEEEANLMEAAENAVAEHWKGGTSGVLPLPPAGFQWEVGETTSANRFWDSQEQKVHRNAELVRDAQGKAIWSFSVAGINIEPFDARPIVSPCKLDIDDLKHQPRSLQPVQEKFLRTVLYVQEHPDGIQKYGGAILEAMTELHDSAEADRAQNPSEGLVYDWMQIAQASPIPTRTWRDALLAIRTRLHRHVILGQGIRSNGNGTPHDMSEGVLLRIFHALECLYPMALRKEGAFKFRVRPLGASYHHLLSVLERLGRGMLSQVPAAVSPSEHATHKRKLHKTLPRTSGLKTEMDILSPRSKRSRRKAATVASKRLATNDTETGEDYDPAFVLDNQNNDDMVEDETLGEAKAECHASCLPEVTTKLWDHQQFSSDKIIAGITQQGKHGLADASAVGAGKTLTALSVINRLAQWLDQTGKPRHGSLVMLPTKALIREWLREIATHTTGFHVVEQREDGTLFSLTYNKKNCPIDSNTIVLSTLDRVCSHPFVRQSAWDFVVIDECLSVQNSSAKRTPSAWRQIEISTCGVLMLSATFFRAKYTDLFYMIRMLRSPLPRTKEWLPATIHEHIVCQIPETDRSWQMIPEMVKLEETDFKQYRSRVDAFKRRQLNDPDRANGLELFKNLRLFLREKYEGRDTTSSQSTTYTSNSVMAKAISKLVQKLLRKGRRPLIFADTGHEADFLVRVLKSDKINVETWKNIATKQVSGSMQSSKKMVIVAVKTVEGQGINMQHHSDTLICRPTVGDHLEQMKGRIDRPGQKTKNLQLYVVFCGHTIEEAAFANINLAGNFFRQYIAPVAERYRERIDLTATLAVAGKQKLKPGTVLKAWKEELEKAGISGSFASVKADHFHHSPTVEAADDVSVDDTLLESESHGKESEPKYNPRNTVLVNKGDPLAVTEAKERARNGEASSIIREWLFASTAKSRSGGKGLKGKSLPHTSVLRYSDQKPAMVLDADTVKKAVAHLATNDPQLAALIARVGADALIRDIGTPKKLTQGSLFDRALRAITFTMVSVSAGNVFMKKLGIKIGALLETYSEAHRNKLLSQLLSDMRESGKAVANDSPETLLALLLEGRHNEFIFTPALVGELVGKCYMDKGKRVGHPHLSGDTVPCGKNDDPRVFLELAREHARGGSRPVSAGYSMPKASFIISLVDDFNKDRISGQMVAAASDREAFKLLTQLKGIGDWSAGGILMHHFNRADIMLYGDLTVRNYLNDLYNINHVDDSETLLESAADFEDNATNRNLIDDLAERNGWKPYRSVVNYLMYHLQEENLVLL